MYSIWSPLLSTINKIPNVPHHLSDLLVPSSTTICLVSSTVYQIFRVLRQLPDVCVFQRLSNHLYPMPSTSSLVSSNDQISMCLANYQIFSVLQNLSGFFGPPPEALCSSPSIRSLMFSTSVLILSNLNHLQQEICIMIDYFCL